MQIKYNPDSGGFKRFSAGTALFFGKIQIYSPYETVSNLGEHRMMNYIGGVGNSFCRKSFSIDRTVAEAILTVAADPHTYLWPSWMEVEHEHNWLLAGSFLKYRVFLNGAPAAVGPFRPVRNSRAVAERYDVTGLLRQGENVLAVQSRGEKYGFALTLELTFSDGSRQTVATGSGWKRQNANDFCNPVCWWHPALGMSRGTFGPGEQPEHLDGTRLPQNWERPGFDDSGWEAAAVTAVDPFELEAGEALHYTPVSIAPVRIEQLGDGRIVADFGRAVVGGIELTSPCGAEIELRLGEELLPSGGVRFQMRTGNCYQEGWRFPENGGTLSHFGMRSFRYAELLGYPGRLDPAAIRAVSITLPFREEDSAFSCSDPRLERVWELCRNSIRYTTLDVYYDCPSRERMAYEADAYINMLTHFAVEHQTATARRTILYQMNHYTWPCEWRMFMIPVVYEYYMHTGDLGLVREVWPRLKTECTFHHLLKDGLVEKFPMRVIVDWPMSCRDEYEFGPAEAVPNAFLYRDLCDQSKLAAALGLAGEAREYEELAVRVKRAFNTRLYDPESGLFLDNAASRHAGFHANMFALAFGVADDDKVERPLAFLVESGMKCSVYGAQFYLEALFRYGCAEKAVELMTSDSDRSWLEMIRLGATCATEAWNPELKPNMSFVHPWGSAPGNMIMRGVFGLRPTKPGWEEFECKPQPGGLKSGRYRIRVPSGIITAEFDHENGELVTRCTHEDLRRPMVPPLDHDRQRAGAE